MKQYVEYEARILSSLKRGLITHTYAISSIQGYLKAMLDFEIITKDRYSGELEISVKKILEIKQKGCK